MKKIFFMSFIFLALIISVKANEEYYIMVNDGENITNIPYKDKKLMGKYAFLLSPYDNINILDETKINNLAYISNLANDTLINVVIQKLIWEETNPTMTFNITKNNNQIDITNELNYIKEELKKYDKMPSIADKEYEINYKEPLILETKDYSLTGYYINENISANIYENKVEILLNSGGTYNIDFKNKPLNIYDNYVYANNVYYKNFQIKVNVLANEIKFNFYLPNNEDYYFKYSVFNENNEFIEDFILDNNNNTIYFKKGINVYVKETTENSIYENSKDMYFLNDSEIYNIDIYKEYKEYNVSIKTSLINYQDKDYKLNTFTDITIYDYKFNKINEIKCNDNCNIKLRAGSYIIKDNITKEKEYLEVYSNTDIEINRYLLNGLITSDEINSVCSEEECITLIKDGNFILSEKPLEMKEYLVKINNEEKIINFNDTNNIMKINGYGIFYILKDNGNEEKDNNVSNEEKVENNQNIENIIINIPNTRIDAKIECELYYEEKNFYNFNSISNNHCVN